MEGYTLKIQEVKNYAGEFQLKGAMDKEKAIEQFQLFPWEEQVTAMRNSTEVPTTPKMVFTGTDQRELMIEATSTQGFNVQYLDKKRNKVSDFFISNNFELSPVSPEEILELFFDNSLENQLVLKDIEKPPEEAPVPLPDEETKKTESAFNTSHWSFISPRAFVWFIFGITYWWLSYVNEGRFPMIINYIFIVLFLTPVLIHLNYYLNSLSVKVEIDSQNNELAFFKGSMVTRFTRDDIFRCQVTTGKHSMYSTVHNYSYVWFILHNGTQILITCFVDDPYKIVKALNCKYEERPRTFPFLPM